MNKTKHISVRVNEEVKRQLINEAKKHLLNSCPIIYPTDTLYSFGAMADDDVAIKKINELKKRTSPISIIGFLELFIKVVGFVISLSYLPGDLIVFSL